MEQHILVMKHADASLLLDCHPDSIDDFVTQRRELLLTAVFQHFDASIHTHLSHVNIL